MLMTPVAKINLRPSFEPVVVTTAWPHSISGQVLSSHSIVSSSRNVRPCSPWGGLLFCATLTGRRGGHTPFVQTGAETPDTGVEAVKPDPGASWEGHSRGMGDGVGDENAEPCGVVHPLRIPMVIRPLRLTYVVVR